MEKNWSSICEDIRDKIAREERKANATKTIGTAIIGIIVVFMMKTGETKGRHVAELRRDLEIAEGQLRRQKRDSEEI